MPVRFKARTSSSSLETWRAAADSSLASPLCSVLGRSLAGRAPEAASDSS